MRLLLLTKRSSVITVSCQEVTFCELWSSVHTYRIFHRGRDEGHSRNGTVNDQLALISAFSTSANSSVEIFVAQ